MTPGARIAAAAGVLDKILAGDRAEVALTRWARGSRFAGSKDRAAVRDHVFDALRCRRSYGVLGGGETGRGLMIGSLRARDLEPGEFLNGEGYALPPLSSSDEGGDLDAAPRAVRWDLPDWLAERFEADLGAQAEEVALALRNRAPVYLRVNSGKSDVVTAQAALAEDGIATVPVGKVKTALQVTENERRIRQSKPYQDGWVELQDASSQAAVLQLPLQNGMRVLDYCAGGGGKALGMAAVPGVRVYAHDALPQRMADLPERAARAGVDIPVLTGPEVRKAELFDLVLVDAPCSGSGTWRRDPDAKWRLTEADLAQTIDLQGQILAEAAEVVQPGGVLAYATCSVIAAENAEQKQAFLSCHEEWTLMQEHQWMPGPAGDGFFLAILRKPD